MVMARKSRSNVRRRQLYEPHDTVRFSRIIKLLRIDVVAWFRSLARKKRRIAYRLLKNREKPGISYERAGLAIPDRVFALFSEQPLEVAVATVALARQVRDASNQLPSSSL